MKMRRSRLPADSSLSFPSSTLTTASLMPSCYITALAMDNECPPSRALATLASAGPNTLVYDAGREGVLTVSCSVSEIINLTL